MITTLVMTALFLAAPEPRPDAGTAALTAALTAEVRQVVGDAEADVVVHELRVGDQSIAGDTFIIELSKAPARLDRPTRVRGRVRTGSRSTWIAATVEIRGARANAPATGPWVVQRGDRVTARISDASFRVSAEAEALAAGRQGERIAVRVLASSKTLEGRVVGPGVVELGDDSARGGR